MVAMHNLEFLRPPWVGSATRSLVAARAFLIADDSTCARARYSASLAFDTPLPQVSQVCTHKRPSPRHQRDHERVGAAYPHDPQHVSGQVVLCTITTRETFF
jgi:hypothetical protein